MSKYVRVTEGLNDKGFLTKLTAFEEDLKNFESDKDHYVSAYYYNDEQYEQFNKTQSVRGITDVKTDKLLFDFDNKNNVELARQDAIEVVKRIAGRCSIDAKNIEIYFSGSKGFTVGVKLDRMITPEQHQTLAIEQFGKGLQTLDRSIYNASRIIRVPNSRHQETGLYKVHLSFEQLKNCNIDQIKKLAQRPCKLTKQLTPIAINESFLQKAPTAKPKTKEVNLVTLENALQFKPRHWKDYKWALVNAVGLEANERHNAMMVIAATCRGYGYTREITEGFLSSFDEKYAEVTKQDVNPAEVIQCLDSVFDPNWSGGQYSYESNPWLKGYCERLSIDVKPDKKKSVSIDEAFDLFSHYATNIDALTIQTGIPRLDKAIRMTIGMSIGVVAAPSVGKSSLAIQILNNACKQNIPAIFFSYDMFHSLIYQKLIQKHMGITPEEIFEHFKAKDEDFLKEVRETINREYKNIKFCFDAGQTTADIEATIAEVEEEIGQPIRLIIVDYNELVVTDISDSTQSSNFVAQKLREIANTRQLCCISLFQPNKMAGSPADALKSYRSAKGGSGIEQSVRVMLGMYRPGYNPDRPEDDRFITISCLKNNMGSTFSLDLGWEGLTGTIKELDDEEREVLKAIRQRRAEENSGGSNWSN